MDDDSKLPWGSLPIEQYLIQNWIHSSPEAPAQQRLRLIRDFLNEDNFPGEWLPDDGEPTAQREPTTAEVETILRPWRSHDLRSKAWGIHYSEHEVPLLLRIHYDPDMNQRAVDDKKFENWAHASEELSDNIDWACLNDANAFNFGSDWQRVHEVLPEVAGPVNGSGKRKREPFDFSLPQFKDALHHYKRTFYKEWKENPRRFIENKAACLQKDVTANYILVADQEAFQSNHLRLIYLDYKLNIVRESRIQPDLDITDIVMDWYLDALRRPYWEQGIGEKYQVDGELGIPLYQLTAEDWADPPSNEIVESDESDDSDEGDDFQ